MGSVNDSSRLDPIDGVLTMNCIARINRVNAEGRMKRVAACGVLLASLLSVPGVRASDTIRTACAAGLGAVADCSSS